MFNKKFLLVSKVYRSKSLKWRNE